MDAVLSPIQALGQPPAPCSSSTGAAQPAAGTRAESAAWCNLPSLFQVPGAVPGPGDAQLSSHHSHQELPSWGCRMKPRPWGGCSSPSRWQ